MQDGPLVERYRITHKDGMPVEADQRFFVLKLDNPDERERAAFYAFIDACRRTGYHTLADDLWDTLGFEAEQQGY